MTDSEETLRIFVGIMLFFGLIFWSFLWFYILRFFIGLLKLVVHARSVQGVIVDNQGISRSGANYVHPCEGQCEDQSIVLNKSPTPMYKHRCRAPCGSSTRSGRYYKGKRRIQTW